MASMRIYTDSVVYDIFDASARSLNIVKLDQIFDTDVDGQMDILLE